MNDPTRCPECGEVTEEILRCPNCQELGCMNEGCTMVDGEGEECLHCNADADALTTMEDE